MDRNKNLGDAIDYGQRKGDDIGEEVQEWTVCLLFLAVCCEFPWPHVLNMAIIYRFVKCWS
jgi:hypothetical protein